jgi:hypothetical protein
MADTTAGGTGTADGKPKRKSWGKRILLGLAGLVVGLLLLALLAPSLLGTAWGRGIVVSQINSRIAGKVSIDKLSLAWFSGQEIGAVMLTGPDGKPVLRATAIKMPGATLWGLLRGSKDFGAIEVVELAGNIEQYADGTTNLAAAIKMAAAPGTAAKTETARAAAKPALPRDLKVKLTVTGGAVTYSAPGMAAVEVKDLGVVADLLDLEHINLNTRATVSQSGSGGTITVKAIVQDLLAADGAIDVKAAAVDGFVGVTDLPVGALDAALKRNGALVQLLGPKLTTGITLKGRLERVDTTVVLTTDHVVVNVNGKRAGKVDLDHLAQTMQHADELGYRGTIRLMDVPTAGVDALAPPPAAGSKPSLAALLGPVINGITEFNGDLTGATGHLKATTTNLHADAGIRYANSVVTVTDGTKIHLTVTPDSWTALAGGNGAAATLTKSFDVDFAIQRLEAAVGSAGVDLAGAKIDTSLVVTPIVLNAPDLGGLVQVRDTSATITSEGLAKLVKAGVHAVAEQDGQPGTVDATATLTDVLTAAGAVNKDAMAVDVQGGIKDLPLPVLDKVMQLNGLLGGAIGPKLNATLTMAFKPTGAGVSTGTFALKADARNISADLSNVAVTSTKEGIAVAAGGKGTVVIQPALAAYFLQKPAATQPATAPPVIKLLEPVTMGLAIGAIHVPMKDGKLDTNGAALDVSATVDKVVADGVAGPGTMTATGVTVGLKAERIGDKITASGTVASVVLPAAAGRVNPDISNVRFGATGTAMDKPVTAGLVADVAQGAQKGTVRANVTINDAKNPLSGLKANVNVRSLPVAIVDALARQNGKLVALLGDQLASVTVHADTDGTRVIRFTASVESPQLKVVLGGNLQPEIAGNSTQHLSLDKSSVELTVTPEGYAAWTTPTVIAGSAATIAPAPRAVLDSAMTLKVAVNQVDIGWKAGATEIDPQQLKLAVQATGTGGEFKTAQGRVLRLDGLTASVDTQDLTRQVKVLVNTSLIDPANAAAPAKVVSLVNISGLALPGGTVNLDNATVQVGIALKVFPVALLDQLLARDGEFAGLMGNTMTLTANGNITPTGKSPLFLILDSDNAKANLAAIVDGGMHGMLRLAKDATVTLTVTPELSEAFLKKITGWVNPSSGDKPISLMVHHDTFAMPLGDLNLKKVVADADMDMGVLNMKANDPITSGAFTALESLRAAAQNDGKVDAMSLLQGGASLLGKSKNAPPQTVTFTPMTMHLENGVATYTNMTMTMQDLAFGFQGNVNMNNKANHLTMTILGESIAKAFPKWAGSVKAGNDITVAIGGTYDAPTLDYKTLGTSVLKFAAGAGAGGKGKTGQLLQGLGGLLDKGSKKDRNAPATQQ